MQEQGTETETKARPKRKPAPGIVVRHARSCASRSGKSCSCAPSYEAWVYSVRDGKKIRKTFATLSAAKGWRVDAMAALRKGTMRAPAPITFGQAAEAWLESAKAGAITKKGGRSYKPSAIRSYERSLRTHVLPVFGSARLSSITRVDVQDFADELLADGSSPSTVRNTITSMRVVYRRAVSRGEIAVNPSRELTLATSTNRRERVASPKEASELLEALPAADRGLWAVAFYAGLRRGELRALRWEEVNLAKGIIRIARSWDEKEGLIDPKYEASRREVPIIALLRDYLAEHRALTGRDTGLVFGRSETEPFTPTDVRKRSLAAWAAKNKKMEEEGLSTRLEPIGLHECRHTCVTLMWEAGLPLEEIGDYIGHAGTYMTDKYRHLREGRKAENRRKLDEFFARADSAERIAQVERAGDA